MYTPIRLINTILNNRDNSVYIYCTVSTDNPVMMLYCSFFIFIAWLYVGGLQQ